MGLKTTLVLITPFSIWNVNCLWINGTNAFKRTSCYFIFKYLSWSVIISVFHHMLRSFVFFWSLPRTTPQGQNFTFKCCWNLRFDWHSVMKQLDPSSLLQSHQSLGNGHGDESCRQAWRMAPCPRRGCGQHRALRKPGTTGCFPGHQSPHHGLCTPQWRRESTGWAHPLPFVLISEAAICHHDECCHLSKN